MPKSYFYLKNVWPFFNRSLGCTVVEMLTGKPPLGHLPLVAAMFTIANGPIVPTLPEGVSQAAKEFIQAALTWLVLLAHCCLCRPKPTVTNVVLLFPFWRHHLQKRHHLHSLSAGGKRSFQWFLDQSDWINWAWNTHEMLRNLSEKHGIKFVSTIFGLSMAGMSCLDDVFSWILELKAGHVEGPQLQSIGKVGQGLTPFLATTWLTQTCTFSRQHYAVQEKCRLPPLELYWSIFSQFFLQWHNYKVMKCIMTQKSDPAPDQKCKTCPKMRFFYKNLQAPIG